MPGKGTKKGQKAVLQTNTGLMVLIISLKLGQLLIIEDINF